MCAIMQYIGDAILVCCFPSLRVNTDTVCSMSKNEMECKYIFSFLQIDAVRKGLTD